MPLVFRPTSRGGLPATFPNGATSCEMREPPPTMQWRPMRVNWFLLTRNAPFLPDYPCFGVDLRCLLLK